ncbi:MAG TPA: SusC/RagA family TonB-linked outer membrane protein [Microscillaceae bacterium]|nr:SusC/RagA family TonB-linked outer membrane protein [Microscillaceae bacterium]
MSEVYNDLLANTKKPTGLYSVAKHLTKKCHKLLGLALVFCLLQAQAFAQTQISGKITDNKGEPLPGATILEKGTNNGAATAADGTYTITVQSGATLIISFVGYASQEIEVGAQTTINVTLLDDVALKEVVVVGYGTQKKSDVTGVVTKIDTDKFNKGPIVSPDQLINGKIAGVQIQSNSGEPGGQVKVRIRGGTSVNASNEPLYVIDGVPVDNAAINPGGFQDGRNPLNFLNPNDIESFTVLKDASATAIYGSRGNNGVILITTKRGKAGQGRLSYNNWFSFSTIARKVDVFNADEFRSIVQTQAPSRVNELGTANTNWQDELYRVGTGQSHNLGFSGGTKTLSYRASVGYVEQEGVIKGSSSERISLSLNLNQRALNDDLKITTSIKASQTNDVFVPNGVIGSSLVFDPTQPILDPSDTQYGGFFEYANDLANKNPVAELTLTDDQGKNIRSVGNIQFDYSLPFVKGLSANLNLGYDIFTGSRSRFLPSNLRSQFNDNGEVRRANFTRTSGLLEFYLKYTKELTSIKSKIDVTGGYSYQNFRAEFPEFRAFNLSNNLLGPNSAASATMTEAFITVEPNRLISFYGRVNFSYADKVLLTATYRRDGSSRFNPENQWGNFPSVALAYRISEEAFLKNSSIISDLKIRAGYGVTGNQEIGNFQFLPRFTQGLPSASAQFGNAFINTLRADAFDPNLKWEELRSFNIGLDFGLFGGRINGSIEYYTKTTTDLLFTVPVAAGANLSDRVLTNIGELESNGIEFALDATAINTKDFRWNLSYNIAFNRNKLLKFTAFNDPSFIGILQGGIAGGVGNNVQILQIGQQLNSFFLFKHKLDANGRPLVDGVDHNGDGTIDMADMYEDISGPDGNPDGMVNDLDKRIVENPAPAVIMGLTSNMTYKDFDFSFTLRANLGNYVYNNVRSNGAYYNRVILDAAPSNMPRAVTETNFTAPQYFSDVYLENASFLRLDNISLGYRFDKLLKNKLKLRAFVTAQNVFVITDYTGLDPEIANRTSDGIDNDIFPRARTFIFGVNIDF